MKHNIILGSIFVTCIFLAQVIMTPPVVAENKEEIIKTTDKEKINIEKIISKIDVDHIKELHEDIEPSWYPGEFWVSWYVLTFFMCLYGVPPLKATVYGFFGALANLFEPEK